MDPRVSFVKRAAAKYRQPDRVVQDAAAVFERYTNLHVAEDTYTHNDGTTARLLVMNGTVPVQYRAATYNIPLEIWLPDLYPVIAPIIYVRPTRDMLVNPSRDVDPNGKVFHPSLHYWDYRNSHLHAVLASLQQAFSEHSPVYAKPAAKTPPPPPKPAGLSHLSSSGITGSVASSTPNLNSASSHPHRHSFMAVGSFDRPTVSTNTGPSSSGPQGGIGGGQGSGSLLSALNRPADSAALPPPLDPHALKLGAARADAIEAIRRDYDAWAPPIAADVDRLVQDSKALYDEQAKLTELQAAADRNEHELTGALEIVDRGCTDFGAVVTKWKERPAPPVDEIFVASDPVQAQLIELAGDDHAIEDTLYVLGKALDDEKIDSASYLKNVRSLAKEQFMVRALAHKCALRVNEGK